MPLRGTGLTALQGCWSPRLEALWSCGAAGDGVNLVGVVMPEPLHSCSPQRQSQGPAQQTGADQEPLDLAQGANSRSQA